MTRASASLGSSCDSSEHAAFVRNLLLSQQNEISHASVTTTEGEGASMVGNTFGERKEKCRLLTVSSELELRRVFEGNASLAVAMISYKVRVKNFEK